MNPRISVIVPVFNDTQALASLLWQLRSISSDLEVVVADGGRDSEVGKICRRYGAVWLLSPRGRSVQMNRGAARSRGEVLWFLHADAVIDPSSVDVIETALADPGTAGGAFRFRLHQRHWYATLLDWGVNLRSRRMKLPYGDQGYFVRRSVFESMGRYREIPFLEDVEFIRRMRRYGEIAILSTPIGVSSRRWEREGFFYTTIRNWLVTIAYFRGVPPERLVGYYSIENGDGNGRDESIADGIVERLGSLFSFEIARSKNRPIGSWKGAREWKGENCEIWADRRGPPGDNRVDGAGRAVDGLRFGGGAGGDPRRVRRPPRKVRGGRGRRLPGVEG